MPVPSRITDLSATAADNSPAGTDTVGPGLDDYLRGIQAVIKGDLATKGADIASATTTDLGAVQGIAHDITGTTTITGFGTVAAGVWKVLKFEGALTLTHNATSLILPGGENITTADGDTAIFISEGSGNWRCLNYSPAAINPAKTVSTDESQTLTNKTLTSPTIQGTVGAGTGLTLPALTLGGVLTGIIDSATGQIKFPASQNASNDANTLDDYEEGSWAPSWTAESGDAPAIGNGTLTGRYVKIGRNVLAQVFLLAGSTTTFGSGGPLRFDLPFAATAAPAGAAAFSGVAYIDDTGTGWSLAFPVCRATTFVDINLNTNGTIGTSRMTNAAPMTWTTGDSLIVTMSYITSA